ncbi:MAG TPA: HAD family phosphatase [Syntrophomonadaceae bacterium]|nr:HAD family phosphatase [Syntrophomonadaceae bacterium]
MHNIKLVAIDLDDTLLRDDLTISQFSRDTLQQVQEAGVTVTLATGRMLPSARPYAEQLGFDVPLITYQGALVKNVFSGEVLYNCPLSQEVASMVIQYGRRRKVHVNLYVEDKLFVERVTEAGEHYERLAGVPFTRVDDLEELLENDLPYKMLLIDDEQVIDQELEELQGVLSEAGLEAYLTKSKPTYLEVNHPRATKGTALKKLAEWMGISREQVVAFGDSYNDLKMLEYAGYGFAVANAYPEVCARARYTTASNNEDGVALALQELVLDGRKELGR